MQLLHSYSPSPILTTLGALTLYWYGFFYAVSIALGYWLISRTLRRQSQTNDPNLRAWSLQLTAILPDLALALVVVGLAGARLYHVLNEPTYYFSHPLYIFAFWRGGLAIHGALVADILFLWWYTQRLPSTSEVGGTFFRARTIGPQTEKLSRRHNTIFLFLLDLLAPAMLLGQAIGRWGNYFNQELFGKPTNLPWGIPIDLAHRPLGFEAYTYFHPTFLYESLWDLIGAIILLSWQYQSSKLINPPDRRLTARPGFIFFTYLAYMALGRLLVEYLRIDTTPIVGLRLPADVSILIIGIGIWGFVSLTLKNQSSIL